jgi:hypothetical protein
MDSFSNGEYSARLPNPPLDGLYTFTVSDSYGNQAKSYYYLTKGTTIPPPDITTFNASSGASGITLSWSAISGYDGNLSYRVKVYKPDGTEAFHTATSFATTSFTFSGVSTPPTGNTWTVEAFDKDSEKISNSSSTELPPIPYALNNTLPYFQQASVYTASLEDGTFNTNSQVRVGDPSGTLSTLTISGPNGFTYSFNVASQCSPEPGGIFLWCLGWTVSSPTPPAPAEAGLYTFKAGNDYGNATTSFYRTLYNVPVVDSTTCRASGDPTAPILSWSTPATADRPLYYQVWVLNPSWTPGTQPNWFSSGWTTNTSIRIPPGTLSTLPPGESYRWRVIANDTQYFGITNTSLSPVLDLTMNTMYPYFTYANVYSRTDPSGQYIAFSVQANATDGTLPANFDSVQVTGPDSTVYNLKSGYDPAYNEFYYQTAGTPLPGEYTFAVTVNGHTATTYKYHRLGDGPIPKFDENSLQASGSPLWPMISWSNVKSSTATPYPGRVYYQARVRELGGNIVHSSSWSPDTSTLVPAGKLSSGKVYQYQVRTQDASSFMACDNRAVSSWHLLPTINSDFNLDGKPDLIWRNISNGANVLWLMNGATKIKNAALDTVADLSWKMVGTADFNGDGYPDILWRNSANGMNLVWYMGPSATGPTKIGKAFLDTVADINWKMVGIADFNGDGYPDILWRNSSNGMNLVWYMGPSATGPTKIGKAFLNTVGDLNWEIVGTADFNGDGHPDILWKNTSLGMTVVVVWYMNGVTQSNWSYYNNGYYTMYVPGQAGLPWNLVGLSDIDGDGYPDTIWRNTSTGANRVVHTYNYYNYTSLFSYFSLYDHYFMWTPNYSDLPAVGDLNWTIVSR